MSKTPRDRLFDTLCKRIEAFGLTNQGQIGVEAGALIDRLLAEAEPMAASLSDAAFEEWWKHDTKGHTPQTIQVSIMDWGHVGFAPASGTMGWWRVIHQVDNDRTTTLTLQRWLVDVGIPDPAEPGVERYAWEHERAGGAK